MKNLRLNLLTNIISSSGVYHNKYSGAYNSLKGVITLELKENGKDKIPESFFKEFEKITSMLTNLDEKLSGIPLLVIEQYFIRNSRDLNKYVYIEYIDKNVEYKIVDLYIVLENFFSHIYLLAVQIADYYNMEIKLKSSKSDEQQEFV